jgi:hypothetical protein
MMISTFFQGEKTTSLSTLDQNGEFDDTTQIAPQSEPEPEPEPEPEGGK